jgi:hypothetical protein
MFNCMRRKMLSQCCMHTIVRSLTVLPVITRLPLPFRQTDSTTACCCRAQQQRQRPSWRTYTISTDYSANTSETYCFMWSNENSGWFMVSCEVWMLWFESSNELSILMISEHSVFDYIASLTQRQIGTLLFRSSRGQSKHIHTES